MRMKASDIAKLAASIAAGAITYNAAVDMLDNDGDVSLLDSLIAAGAGGVAGGLIGGIMDKTGVSGLVDDVADDLFGLF